NIDVMSMTAAERSKRRGRLFAGDAFVLATFGRLHPWQSPEAAMRVIAGFRSGGRSLALLVIGDGPRYNPALFRSLQATARELEIGDRVYWTGALSAEEVSKYLVLADAFY